MAEKAQIEATLRRVVREQLGREVEALEPIAGHLGRRSFSRVRLAGGAPETLIARVDAAEDPGARPIGQAPEPALEPLRALLERCSLPVPARLGSDEAAGVELLEDFGPRSLTAAVAEASPEERRSHYAEACSFVPRLQAIPDPGGVEAFQRRLDDTIFDYKSSLFCQHVLRLQGRDPTPGEVEVARHAFTHVAQVAAEAPARLAHRDLQSSNLIVRRGRRAGERLGLIDLQGALLAPPEYDLVCLLRDSYVDLPEDEVAAHLDRTRPELPDAPDAESFARRFDLLTLTRKGKDCARFLQVADSRREKAFLRYVPRTLAQLRSAARRAGQREPGLRDCASLLAELPDPPCER